MENKEAEKGEETEKAEQKGSMGDRNIQCSIKQCMLTGTLNPTLLPDKLVNLGQFCKFFFFLRPMAAFLKWTAHENYGMVNVGKGHGWGKSAVAKI